jgi:hypothetical protein
MPEAPEIKRVHPAIDIIEGRASVGVQYGNVYHAVLTPRPGQTKLSTLPADQDVYTVKPLTYRDVSDRWAFESFAEFVKNPQAPTWGEAYERLFKLADYWTITKDVREKHIISTWTLGTYFYLVWTAYPRLNLHGDTTTGKSKILETIALLAFNALLRVNPTVAGLFRLIDALRPTFCLDEIENLAGDDHKAMMSILNSGYKAGYSVDRMEKSAQGGYEPRPFQVYAPIAFAGIKGLDPILATRCITITTIKSTDKEAINRPSPKESADFIDARAKCYALFLLRLDDVLSSTYEPPDELSSRRRELYLPLLTLASLCSPEAHAAILEYAMEDSHRGVTISEDGAALITALYRVLGPKDSIIVKPSELTIHMPSDQYGRFLRASQIGQLLQRYDIKALPRAGSGQPYLVKRQQLDSLCERYGFSLEGNV